MIGKMANNKLVRGVSKMGLYGGIGAGAVGLAGYSAVSKTTDIIDTQNVNPFQKKAVQGFGKRGINANRLNTDGLVQGLHGNRRKY